MDKAKKNRLKRSLTWGGIALLVAVLAVMPLLAKREAAEDGPVASVLSAQVAVKDIALDLRGGGTLKNKGEMDVNIPTGVKITEFLVKNGDIVQEGDPVAKVDKVTVMEAITGVAETMDYLREKLEEGRDEKVDANITATAGGRVKAVFAQAGQDVQDVMLEHGALALLSIDGMMAVKLETTVPAVTGESVTVTLPDGSEVIGRVESNLSGQVIVTVEDEGYDIGQKVTVTRGDNTPLGSGELYVHNAWKAIAYTGTIDAVQAKVEKDLPSGATLFTLKDRDYEGELRRRASQHREYEELLQRLLAMYDSGYIAAPRDGMISGVDEDSAHLLSGESFDAEVSLLGGRDDWSGIKLMLLSNEPAAQASCSCPDPNNHATSCVEGCTGAAGCQNVQGKHKAGCPEECSGNSQCQATNHQPGCYQLCTETDDPTKCPNDPKGQHKPNCIHKCSSEKDAADCKGGTNHYPECVRSCLKKENIVDCPATKHHYSECIGACTSEDVEKKCQATQYHHYDCIEKCDGTEDCLASKHKSGCALRKMTFTARVGKVDYVGNTVVGVFWDKSTYPVAQVNGKWEIVSPDFSGQNFITPGELAVSNPKSFQKGDVIMAITGYENGSAVWSRTVKYSSGGGSGMPGGMPGFVMPNFDLSVMMGGFGGFGHYSGMTEEETENLYDLDGSTLMTVTPDEGVEVEISLDERDIDKIQVGMKATIKLEALRNTSVEAVVTKVGAIGVHSGSTGKFQVWVEADAIPDSLSGMSCMVTIHQDTRKDVRTLPVAAVSQDGAKSIVYTALDKKTGQPTAPQEITTGVSDGLNVEVISLDEGVEVYYLYYDVLEIDHTAEERQFTMT